MMKIKMEQLTLSFIIFSACVFLSYNIFGKNVLVFRYLSSCSIYEQEPREPVFLYGTFDKCWEDIEKYGSPTRCTCESIPANLGEIMITPKDMGIKIKPRPPRGIWMDIRDE